METSRTGSEALMKLLAIIGFFAILAGILWLIVQGVRLFPSAFSSLASIAETVSDYRPGSELAIKLQKNIVNSGETFTVNWTDMGRGSYVFSYACTEGVLLSVRTSEGILREIACTDTLSLPYDVHGLFLTIHAREQRFSDVDMNIMFDAEKGDAHVAKARITVVNATMPTSGGAIVTKSDATPTRAVVVPPPPTPSVPAAPAKNLSQSAATAVAITPRSFADGFIDLRAMYLGVGIMENDAFVPKATFNQDDTAAFRFEVKNIGTKTSDAWTYELKLPGNVEYTALPQSGLTPNERAIFTISFELGDTTSTAVKIGGEVTTVGDSNATNNAFDWSVKIK